MILISTSCSGNYYGVDGRDVYTRSEAIQILSIAQILNFSNCSNQTSINNLGIDLVTKNPRVLLDGAYFLKSDVHTCEIGILVSTCKSSTFKCEIASKEIFKGKLFQGGF